MEVAVYGDVVASRVDGPGDRAVVHFAGCSVGCAGCFNPLTHARRGPGVRRVPVQSLAREMLAVSRSVTISGGEPTDQLSQLFELCRELRALGCDDVVMFTGRRIERLERDARWRALVDEALVDVVVDGPYMARRPAADGMRGSDNQRIIALTGRWSPEDFASREVEVTIREDGSVVVTGFPGADLLSVLGARVQ